MEDRRRAGAALTGCNSPGCRTRLVSALTQLACERRHVTPQTRYILRAGARKNDDHLLAVAQ